MEPSGSSRRQGFKDETGEPTSLHSLTPSISSSVSSRSSFSSLTHSTIDVPIFLDPEVLIFCDDPHATGPRKLALKIYNPNDFHIRFEIKSTNSERYTVSEPTGTIQDKSWKELIVSLIPFARQHRSSERSTSPSGARPGRQSSVESAATTSSALIEEVTSDRFRIIVSPRGVLQEKATLPSRDVSLHVCHTLASYKRLFASSSKFPLVAPSASTLPAIPSVSESVHPNFPRQFPHEAHCPLASAAPSTSSQLERCTCSPPSRSTYAPSPEALPPVAAAASPAPSPVLRAGLLWPALAACCLFALFVPVAELEELQRQVALLTAQAKSGAQQATAGAATGTAAASASGVRAALGAAMSALHVPPPDWLLVAFESLDSLLVSLPVLWHACALPVAAKCAASFVLGAAAAVYFNRFLLVAWRT